MEAIEKYNASNEFGWDNNYKLRIIGKGHIEYTMDLETRHLALPDLIHGGAIAGFMDAVLSVAAFSAVAEENKNVATAEFKINYLRPVRKPEKLRGVGKVLKHGQRTIVSSGEIFDQSGELVAVGTGTLIPMPG